VFISTVPVGVFRCNCTIVGCEITREAVVIDPGDQPDRILDIIRVNDLQVTVVVHTHAHLDHVMASAAITEQTGALARLHAGDRRYWEHLDVVAASYRIPAPSLPPLAAPLEEGDPIRFGRLQLRVIHTPGHTPGSCCFALDGPDGVGLLFTGDTLLRGTIGMNASTGSTPRRQIERIVASIRERLLTFADRTRVIPGHGAETDIGFERRHNPFLSEL
jgi:hydroxyacylglutathione hydrolase